MQQGRPTALSNQSVEHRKNQLRIQIQILEEQLASAKRDLRQLEKGDQK